MSSPAVASARVDHVRVLLLEDMPTDAELIERALRQSGLAITAKRVETKETFTAALAEFKPDILLADYKLPDFDGLSAITFAHKKYPDLPIIVVTGVLGDETAVELIKAGAKDYVLKDRMARLPSAVEKAVSEAAEVAELRLQTAARQTAERSLYAVVTHAQDAIIMMNEEGLITFWNNSAERLFGYSGQEAMGRDFRLLLAPEGNELWIPTVDEIGQVAQGSVLDKTQGVTVQKKDGTLFQVALSISVVEVGGRSSAIGVARPYLIQF